MNILIIAGNGLYYDFSASFVHSQAIAYTKLGHRVRVLIRLPYGKRDGFGSLSCQTVTLKRKDGIDLLYMRYFSLSKYGENGWNQKRAISAASRIIQQITDGFPPDIIHAHALTTTAVLGAFLKERLNVPLVITTHGSDTFVPYNLGNCSSLRQRANQADHLICVSSLLKRRIESCQAVVPMSVILNGFQIKSACSPTDRNPVSMIQAGYLVARKKADVTIQALALLRKRHPDAALDIVGSGSELHRFQTLCGELNVSDSVRFHGFLPNPETLAQMAKARFFIMPSINEGFGIVYLEAMASGCITIGTEGEGIADLIVSGENGFLVPPDNPEAIVKVVEWCLEHPEEADGIAENGRKDALALTWEKNAAEYIKLFKELQHGT